MIDCTYKYEVGQEINGLRITERLKKRKVVKKRGVQKEVFVKSYKYICTNCGYSCGEYYRQGKYFDSYSITEQNIDSGNGCFICSKNGAVAPNINSIKASAPDIIKYVVNDIDLLQYSPHSAKVIDCRCPDCNRLYRRKVFKILEYGVPCSCSDGFSYPEKFIFSALSQLNVNFEQQHYIDGSLLRYDFYINDINTIVEVNGIQHYKVKWTNRDEPENDAMKKEFAYNNGFDDNTYIVLDCRESSSEFIKNSLINSKLSTYFDLSKIDFFECARFASSNLVKTACDYWNSGLNLNEIAINMKVNKHTVMKYLSQGNESGMCKYCSGDGVKRYSNERASVGNKPSDVIGVSWHKSSSTWTVRITVNKDRITVCRCKDLNDAIIARLNAEIKYFGYDNAPQKHLFEKYGIQKYSFNGTPKRQGGNKTLEELGL